MVVGSNFKPKSHKSSTENNSGRGELALLASSRLYTRSIVILSLVCHMFPGLNTVNTDACSVRVVSWVTLLFGLCISTSYSAVLFSRLTVDKSDLNIPTLDSVARMRTHSLCVRRSSFGFLRFKVRRLMFILNA